MDRRDLAVDTRAVAPPKLGEEVPKASELADGEALHRLLDWGAVPGPDGEPLAVSLAWVTRVLAVVQWVTCPREMSNMAQGSLPVTGARLMTRLLVCPGSNLHALIVLGCRAARDAAAGLAEVLDDGEGLAAVPGGRYPDPLRAALAGLGPVPAFPLLGWSDASTYQELLAGFPVFYWGSRSLGTRAKFAARRLGGLPGRWVAEKTKGAERFENFDTLDSRMNWDRVLGHNLGAYDALCSRLLTETVALLRLVGHFVHLLRMVYVYPAAGVGLRPKRWVVTLRTVANVDLAGLDSVLSDAVAAAMLPAPWLWHAERELESAVQRIGPAALNECWGVPVTAPDSLDRAGGSCPDNARYVPARVASAD